MKNLLKKLIVVLFLLLMLINNSVLVVISNAVDEIQNNVEHTKMSTIYELNLEKYVNYALDDETKGLMLQANLKTGIKYEEGVEYEPLEFTGVILDLPKINNEYPQNVEVVGISTKASNGDDSAKDFQAVYDSTTGRVKIVALNRADDEGNIYREYDESARDEYTIFIYYSDACYTDKNIDRNIEINGKLQVNLANENGTEITTEIKQNYEVNDNISGLISTNIETSDIYNGFINSNNLNNTTYTTEYTENLKIDVGYKEISGELKISSNNSFVNNNNIINTDEVIYKSTKIYKQDVLDKLGEDGYLKIFDINGELLGEINKDTETLEDGSVEFKYEKEVTEIVISLSKPLNLGTLNIQNAKQIKETMKNIENNKIKTSYSIVAIDNFQEIDGNTGNVIKEEVVEVYNFSNDVIVDINDSETKIDLSVDNNEWTNNMQNDVTFTANFVANDSKYNLFKNPVIEIKLPSEVENVILGDVSLLYGNGLSIKNANVIEKDSCKVIRVELEGNQSEYMLDSMITGSNVLIPVSIIVKKDITSVETNIEMTYSNKYGTINDYEKEGKNSKETSINIVSIIEAEAEMLTSIAMPISEVIDGDEISTEMMATVGNQTLKNESSVYEEQIIKYTAKITNNSDKKLSNVKFVGIIPEGTTYVTLDFGTDYEASQDADDLYKYVEDTSKKEYSETFSLKAHEEKEIFYEVKVNKLSDETEKTIESNLKVYNSGVEKADYSIKNTVKKADMSVELKSWMTYIDEGVYLYRIKVKNNKAEEVKNVNIELLVPDGFEVTETEDYEFGFTEEENKIKINLNKIDANETEDIDLYIKINPSKSNVYEYNINTYAVVTADGLDTYYSNENRQTVYFTGIEVIQTSEKEGKEVAEEEEIEYDFVIRNVSNENIFDGDVSLHITDFLDENVEPISAEYEVFTYNEETNEYTKETKTDNFDYIIGEVNDEEAPELEYYSALPVGEEIKLKLKVKTGIVIERTTIISNISVEYNDITKISNTIKNIIVPEKIDNAGGNGSGNGDGSQDNKDGKYSINGTAWIDSNDDGQISENESKCSNIEVILFNVDTNTIAKDEKNNNITAVTDDNGKYEFNNVEKGKYLVVFKYDSNNYSLATYKKSGVSEQNNSDVIDKELKLENDLENVAVTDILNIESKSINNINIGLVPKQKFDLSLNKSITKVTVEYNDTQKEITYNESKLAKVEISSKKIANTTIIVEYQLEVKNEGDVDAYVDEIVDYIPETLDFDIGLNSNWYDTGNGKLRNSSLSGTRIKAGESKVVKLYLTKKLTDSSIGTITNSAEITKSSNANNFTDIDSVEDNRNENEDDYSEAQLIISIGTGVVTYTLLVIGLIILLIVIRYLINKKIINIKSIGLFTITITTLGIVVFSNNSGAASAIEKELKTTIKEEVTAEAKTHYGSDNKGYELHYQNYTESTLTNGGPFSGNVYIHHTDTAMHKKYPEYLWCSDGRTQCGNEGHYYKLQSVSVNITSLDTKETLANDFYIKNVGIKPDSQGVVNPLDSTKSIVGPFTIETGGEEINNFSNIVITAIANDETVKLVHNSSGDKFYDIVDSSGASLKTIKSKQPFYVSVNTGTSVKSVKLTITKKLTSTVKASYTVKETWKCTSVSGNHEKCKTSNMQVMVRTYKDTITDKDTINLKKSITLKTTSDSNGTLSFYKIDNSEVTGAGYKIGDILDAPSDVIKADDSAGAYLTSGFAKDATGNYVELEDVVSSDNIELLDGMEFIVARRVDNALDGSVQYEYITDIYTDNSAKTYVSDSTMGYVARRNLGKLCI